MKHKSIPPLISGVALTLLTGLLLWQLAVITLMVRATVDVLTALGRLI